MEYGSRKPHRWSWFEPKNWMPGKKGLQMILFLSPLCGRSALLAQFNIPPPTQAKPSQTRRKKTAAPIDHTFIASRQWFRDFQITGFVWGQCWSFFHRRVLHSFGSSVIALSIKADDPLLIIQKFYRTRKKYVYTNLHQLQRCALLILYEWIVLFHFVFYHTDTV